MKYKYFGYYYDILMDTLDYTPWASYTTNFITRDMELLDLGCGTGTLILNLKINGYNVSGLDNSETILEIAREKTKINHKLIDYYLDDMVNFKIDKKFDIMTCYFDTINHLENLDQVHEMMHNVANHLKKDGLFIFDVFSKFMYDEYKEDIKKDNYGDFRYFWKTEGRNLKLYHDLTFITDDDIVNEKYEETYFNYLDMITSEFEIIDVKGDFFDELTDKSERILITLKKK